MEPFSMFIACLSSKKITDFFNNVEKTLWYSKNPDNDFLKKVTQSKK